MRDLIRFLSFSVAALLICDSAATIITERNNVFTEAAGYATFSNRIDSQWIPYGTYNFTSGGTEYLRATSNLAGVVVSVFDGWAERSCIPQNILPLTNGLVRSGAPVATNAHGEAVNNTGTLLTNSVRYTVIPGSAVNWSSYSDDGSFLSSPTNQTARMRDLLNSKSFVVYSGVGGGSNDFFTSSFLPIEERLASYGSGYHTGLAAEFGGKSLEEHILESTAPPISSEWSTNMPFLAEQVDDWVNVFPIYSACSNDVSFWPPRVPGGNVSNYEFRRPHLIGWMYPDHLQRVWDDGSSSSDMLVAVTNLYYGRLIHRPFNAKIEDVLSFDTGWEYSDILTNSFYRSWRNGTSRLDWNRLGIICQLERQMETTFKARQTEDYALELKGSTGVANKQFKATPRHVEFSVTNEIYTGGLSAKLLSNQSSWAYSTLSNTLEVTTNHFGYCFPTARYSTYLAGSIRGTIGHIDFTIDDQVLSDLYAALTEWAHQTIQSNGTYFVRFPIEAVSPGASPSGFASVRIKEGDLTFYPESGGDSISFGGSGDVIQSWVVTDGVYQVEEMSVFKGYEKSTSVYYTSDPATNLMFDLSWPHEEIFNGGWVSQVSVPTLEVMISSTNDYVDVNGDATPIDYSFFTSDKPERAFRFSTFESQSFNELKSRRARSWSILNSAVKAKFNSLAGQNPENAVSISGSDQHTIDTELTNLTAHAYIGTAADAILAYGGAAEIPLFVAWIDDSPFPVEMVDNEIKVGALTFSFENEVGISQHPVRVDGHQDQLIKTTWRFKNLRNPSL